MRIRFLSEQVYEQGGPGNGPRFPAGFVLDESGVQEALGLAAPPTADWTKGFLNRWVQRQVAEVVDDKTPVGAPKDVGSGRQEKPVDLARMTRAELEKVAKRRRVDVSKAKTRADVLAALQKAEKA